MVERRGLAERGHGGAGNDGGLLILALRPAAAKQAAWRNLRQAPVVGKIPPLAFHLSQRVAEFRPSRPQ